MTSDTLVHDEPMVDVSEDVQPPVRLVALDPGSRTVLVVVLAAVVTAVVAPYPVTKLVLGGTLALFWARLLVDLDERFVGMFVLLLPTLQLAPLETLGIAALNWLTVFLAIFGVAILSAKAPTTRVAVSGWIAYFSLALILAALYAWGFAQKPIWPLLVVVKNWLFPFVLFFVGRRLVRRSEQLWFLLLCVALVSLALALHGLRDGVTTGNLETNRPEGLLTGQANLFAGYLAMYGLLLLFVSRTLELGRFDRLLLTGIAFVMVVTLVFTLSRGAWLAFGLAGLIVGFVTNRGAVILLVLAIVVGSRWGPEEAATRLDSTLTAVEESGDAALEDALDGSAALRVIQWKSLPAIMLASPLWGTGLDTYAQRLGEHTGIFRSAHATMVQIGTEMGALGLLAYTGLLASVLVVCVRRTRAAERRSFSRSVGLGLIAATVCLFLLDFTGTRFRAYTVTSYFWLLVGAYLGSTDPAPEAPAPTEDELQQV